MEATILQGSGITRANIEAHQRTQRGQREGTRTEIASARATPPNLAAISVPIPFTDRDITESAMNSYIAAVNQSLNFTHFSLNIDVHEPTNRFLVQVIDDETNEILREIPPESRLDIVARMNELAGLLLDTTA
ncbi:MAG: flagellar protein FlaG [Turicibacter sp.]|nr:flagellar protein FlaG [Turicibacter sp.]